jgi:AcrR family transcriptional regulator
LKIKGDDVGRRSYVSVARAEAASEKKERVVQAAARFLREADSITGFSLDAVAKAADVTRLTVYNQFGSRRGLLEAVFDDIARRGQLFRLNDAMDEADPWKGLELLIAVFCDFWGGDPAVARLHDAAAIDQEFALALLERNERRRRSLEKLVARIAGERVPTADQRDAVDLIFALTSCAMFRSLAAGRSIACVCAIITDAARAAIARIVSANSDRA